MKIKFPPKQVIGPFLTSSPTWSEGYNRALNDVRMLNPDLCEDPLEDIISDYLTGEGNPREDSEIDGQRLAKIIRTYLKENS